MKLSELCRQNGVRAVSLAQAMGVPRQSIYQFGNGHRVSVRKLQDIRDGFLKLGIMFYLSDLSSLLNNEELVEA